MRLKIPNRADKFIKDYRLPIFSTVGLVVILGLMLALRIYEQGILADALGDSKSNGQSYASLLSGDKDAELQKNEIEASGSATQTTQAQDSSVAIDSDGDNTPTTGGGEAPPSDPTEPPGNEEGDEVPPPAEPFSAQISSFGLRSQSGPFPCGSTGGNPSQMCKQYDFAAGVNTYNGPGSVGYALRWAGMMPGEITGGFQATTGAAFTQINKSVYLRCSQEGDYVFRFYLLKPAEIESHPIPIKHYCNILSP